MTFVVPPNSLNELTTVSATSGYDLGDLEYLGLYPLVLPNGSLDLQQSVTDWISHNSNYTQWMFNVKPGLKWSDGTNVTSADILATFGPKFALNSTYDIWGIHTEVANEYALNSSTAVFDLNVTDADFIDKLNIQTFLPVYPASFVNSQGAASLDFGTDVVLGPFYVSNYSSGQFQMVLLRNPYFYTTGLPEPQISQVDINFVETLSQTANNLLAGATDLAPVELSNVPSILKDPNLGVIDEKGFQLTTLEYNDSMYPYNDTAFRQALAYGINQTQFVQQADDGYGTTAYNSEGIEGPNTTLWYNPNVQKYSFNQSEALSLLSSMGITKGSSGSLQYPNGTAVTLGLWTDTDNTADTIGAQVLQRQLQQLGFAVNLQTTSAATLTGDYANSVGGIRSSMILFTATAWTPQIPFIQAFPAWDTVWLPTTPNPYWIYPPSANNEYQGNYTAFTSTDNYTQDRMYFNNMQALDAQYLPTLVLAHPDYVFAYNKQTWANWPTSPNTYIFFEGAPWNFTTFATLTPVSATTTTSPPATSTSTSPSPSTTSSSFTSSPSVSSSSSSQTTSTETTTTSSSNLTLVAVAAVVIVLVVGGIAAVLVRRRKK
jgi:ABC-type transport system substrate-binding protein